MSMPKRRIGTVGITPAGALGVAFFYHLTAGLTRLDGRVHFVEREGSASGAALRGAGGLRIAADDGIVELKSPDIFLPPLSECATAGCLPEVLLICTQPDQLLGLLSAWVKLFESLHAEEGTASIDDLPVLVLASNGIYFQRVRQFLIERLEEGTLFGRLPDLWPELMPRLVARLLRGVTIQTGQREGSGAEAIYRPGPLGRTRIAGGDPAIRARVVSLLGELGAWVDSADTASPTRVEFDKALVNLTANLLGQLAAIDDSGGFRRVTAGEMLGPEHEVDVRELVQHVVAVGRAVRAYREEESAEEIEARMRESLQSHADHVPSSLQWIEGQLQRQTLSPRLTPTEAWLLEPLIRYAHGAALEDVARYFERLTRTVEHRLAMAVAANAHRRAGERAAQRNR
jgi:hypothetical protein